MTNLRELMQMALEALEESKKHITDQRRDKVIEALRAALAQPEPERCHHRFEIDQEAPLHSCCQICGEVRKQPEPEPVACDCDATAWCAMYKKCHRKMLGLKPFVAPPQREWQGLTDEEVWEMDAYKMAITDQETRWLYRFARAIEAKLKEKNS